MEEQIFCPTWCYQFNVAVFRPLMA